MIDYSREGEHALKDISFALVTGEVSKLLPSSIDEVFLNLTTKENENFCVRLCMDGFQVRKSVNNCRLWFICSLFFIKGGWSQS